MKANALTQIGTGQGASDAPGEASSSYSIRCFRGQSRREGKKEHYWVEWLRVSRTKLRGARRTQGSSEISGVGQGLLMSLVLRPVSLTSNEPAGRKGRRKVEGQEMTKHAQLRGRRPGP